MSTLNVTTKLVQNKLGLLNLAQELNNISKACKMMGVSRDTFYSKSSTFPTFSI